MTHRSNSIVVSSAAPVASDTHLGRMNYSYSFAVRQFRPLLQRWGASREVDQPPSRVDYSIRELRSAGHEPVHLGFSPLHEAFLARTVRNAAFVFWEYPDLPRRISDEDPRYNWANVAARFDRVLTASTFTRDAFLRAGVRTPIDVVPVPLMAEWFDVPDWRREQSVRIEASTYLYPLPPGTPHIAVPGAEAAVPPSHVKRIYRTFLKPLLPKRVLHRIQQRVDALTKPPVPQLEGVAVPVPGHAGIDLHGVVYLHVCNPYDERKNWQDLVEAFLISLGDRADAALVIKLVANGTLLPHAVNAVNSYYLELGKQHRCRFALVGGYLSDEAMRELVRGSTYYATATRTEGANLPLMDALAAGRPALSPLHTSMLDYFGPELGWVVPSCEEPAAPSVGRERLLSRWHRVDVDALVKQFRESYEVAKSRPGEYQKLAAAARQRMREYASLEQVWPRFQAALNAVAGGGS